MRQDGARDVGVVVFVSAGLDAQRFALFDVFDSHESRCRALPLGVFLCRDGVPQGDPCEPDCVVFVSGGQDYADFIRDESLRRVDEHCTVCDLFVSFGVHQHRFGVRENVDPHAAVRVLIGICAQRFAMLQNDHINDDGSCDGGVFVRV